MENPWFTFSKEPDLPDELSISISRYWAVSNWVFSQASSDFLVGKSQFFQRINQPKKGDDQGVILQ